MAQFTGRAPLTIDQIHMLAPSAFATEAYKDRSARYAYIPTSDVIQGMMRVGFQPFSASQSQTKIEDKREHTKHMIRFRAPNTSLIVGDTFPEVVLVNSHDGTSAYKLMAGLFRLVCSNGMIVADSVVGSLNIRHTGKVIEEVTSGSIELVEKMPTAIDAIARWKQIQLDAAEQAIFAESAHTIRFADSAGHVNTPIKADQLLRARRWDDKSNDLWTTFNRVQENVIRGGLRAYQPYSRDASGHLVGGRTVSTKEIKGIDQDVRLNKALWTLAERMAALKGFA